MNGYGKTVGNGGCGKCKVYYSEKYHKMVIEKRITPCMTMRGSILPKDPILNILQLVQKCQNQNQLEKCLVKEAAFMCLLKLTRLDCCVEILDFIKDPPSIIMEYCEGGDLRKILDEKELTSYDKLIFIEQILDGIEKIHKFRIIHGDLKCSNLFLKKPYKKNQNKENQVKIGDFGLSAISGELVKGGTPGFLAPEIQQGRGGSFESDIYSLGKVMLEILTCWNMQKVQTINEYNFTQYQMYFPKFLGDVNFYSCVKKCLSSDPNDRPKIQQIIFVFRVYVIKFILEMELMINHVIKNDKICKYGKIGEKGAVKNHKHVLILSNDNMRGYHNGWLCDICREHFDRDSLSWHCKNCGYDVCFDCYEKYKLPYKLKVINNNIQINKIPKYHKIGEKGIVKNHNHVLILSNSSMRECKNGWICDICKRHFSENSLSWRCKNCDYDVCFDCYEKYKSDSNFSGNSDQRFCITEGNEKNNKIKVNNYTWVI